MRHKILSFLTAFAMVFGIIAAPFVNASAAEEKAGTDVGPTADTETKANVTIHKIKVTSTDGFPRTQEKNANEKNTAILGKDNTTEYDGGKIADDKIAGFFGEGAEELTGVKFVYWTFDSKENYETMVKAPESYDTVDEVKALLGGNGTEINSGETIENITVPANGHKYVWAVEKSKTVTVKGEEQTITGGAAVPFGLALPLFKADGNVNTDIHVYPKNTTANEPKVDKDFEGKANAKEDRKEIDNDIKKDVKVGDEVPYDIETIIPAGAKYKTVAWTDQMTEGLTFNNNVKIMIGEKGKETEWDAANYNVKVDGNGFVLELTDAGLTALEEKAKDAEVRLLVKYSATVNKNAKVERPERNDVIFHYGNEPHHGNTPYPTKPSDGKLTVNKEFSDAQGAWKDGEKVTVTIYDAHTGKPVVFKDGQDATVELTKGTKESHTWTGLDNDRQYKVVEKFTPGDEVTYEKQEDGTVKIIDKKTDNPSPKDPQEPEVVTYGHRFQKIDQSTKEGIEGAKFIVKNADGKVLAQKEAADLEADQKAYDAAEKAYKDAVKAGKADSEITPLKDKRDKAYIAVNTEWKWIEDTTDHTGAYVFTSKANGFFKVTGLNKGNYQLIETKAPKGYAENKTPQDFEVKEGSTGETTKLESGELQDLVGFKQIENKKVSIPQTGGIGSIIFVVAGLMIMGLAAYKMKANKEEA